MDKIDTLKSISDEIISIRNDIYIHKGLDYNRQTMSKVLNRLQKAITSGLEPLNSKYLNLNFIKNKGLDTAKYMSFTNGLEQGSISQKSAKYSDRNLLDQIGNLLSSNKSLKERQLDIETYCLAYDQNWFDRDFSSYQGEGQGVPIESVILHDLYKTAREQIKDDLHKYNNNGFRLIKKGVRANQMDSLAALIMISVGNNVLINLGFTSAVKYIIKNIKASLTQVSFEVGNAIYNQFLYSSSSNNIFNSVKFAKYLISELKVSSKIKDQIISIVTEQNVKLFAAADSLLLKITLGEAIVNILKNNTKMGGYLLNGEEFRLPLIIQNWELKHDSSIEQLIYDVINKLNEVAFKINVPVLEFILEYGIKLNLISDPDIKHPYEKKLKKTLREKKN